MATSERSRSHRAYPAGNSSAQARDDATSGVPVHSVLFERPDDNSSLTLTEPEFFRDLNLDQVVAAMAAGREEYALEPFFYTRLFAAAAVRYRQEVVRDLERVEVFEAVRRFAEGMRRMREHLAQSEKLHYELQQQSWFVDAVGIYCDAVRTLAGDLAELELSSLGLRGLRDYVVEYAGSVRLAALVEEARGVKEALRGIRYRLKIQGPRVTIGRYEGEEDYSVQVLETFGRFRQGAVRGYLVSLPDDVEMNHVEAQILDLVARLHPDEFGARADYCERHRDFLDQTIARFDREVQFYLGYLELIERLRAAGLRFCYPRVSARSKEIVADDTFDIALATKLVGEERQVVCNELRLTRPERMLVVSGPNNGGKTTFARMFGQLHHLASLGLPVPGSEARLFLADRIFTHFEREEDIETLRGRFDDELVRGARDPRAGDVAQRDRDERELQLDDAERRAVRRHRGDAADPRAGVRRRVRDICRRDRLAERGDGQYGHGGSAGEPGAADVQGPAQARRRAGVRVGDRREVRVDVRAADGADRHMRVFLLHRDRDFEPKPGLHDAVFAAMSSGNLHAITNVRRRLERQKSFGRGDPARPSSDDMLAQDLELGTLWRAMAGGDEFLFEMARRCVLSGLRDPDEIVYRQRVLADCIAHPATIRELYELAIEALAAERQAGGLWRDAGPSYILRRSVRLLELYLGILRRLRQIADERSGGFRSEGFTRFFATLREELSDGYLETVDHYLRELELERGMVESAELGRGDKGRGYIVHQPPREQSWKERLRLIGSRRPEEYSFELHPRDEAGGRYLERIRGRGINHVADAVAQSADHVQSFFTMLRLELAFYLACLNLRAWLEQKQQPTCLPEPSPEGELALTARGIYDVCLTLHLESRVVGNDVNAEGKSLVMITGANQGGKSTLLRGLGLAQLMMQAGMFVGAESFRASVCTGVFTHYKREEDATMESGKLDEELRRMSQIADQITPGAILLCNESFASTNEREGSEIARQVIRAMLNKHVKVLFVTHMYDLAHSFHAQRLDAVLFLRAGREPEGTRTFKLREGEPLPTSHGQDSYDRIFGSDATSGSVADQMP